MRFRTIALIAAAAALAGVGMWRTWAGISPHSLSLDDLWVADLVRNGTLAHVFALHPPAPIGFIALLDGVTRVLGLGDWQLQSVAWVAYPIVLAGLVWLIASVTGRVAAGVAAAALLSFNDDVAGLGIRVKQYTLDMAITIALLAAGVAARRSWRRWILFAVLSLVALVFSFPSAFVGPLLANVVLLEHWNTDRSRWRPAASAAALYNASVAVVVLAVVRRHVTGPLVDYWAWRFIPHGPWHDITEWFTHGSGWDFISGSFPEHQRWLTVLIPLGIAALLAARETRALGIFVVLFYAELLVANVRGMWPLGEMRLDTFAQPITLLTAAAGLAWPLRRIPVVPELAAAALLVFVVQREARDPINYLYVGDKPIVKATAAELRPDDSLVVFPWTNWAVGYYGPWPAHLAVETASTNGCKAIPERPNTIILPESWHGTMFNARIEAVEGPLLPFLAAAKGRVVYVGTHVWRRDHDRILDVIRKGGFHEVRERTDANAVMVVFERNPRIAPPVRLFAVPGPSAGAAPAPATPLPAVSAPQLRRSVPRDR